MQRRHAPTQLKELAVQRIDRLFTEAESAFPRHPERSERYVTLARKIAMKARITLPRALKQKYCKRCDAYLKAGVTSRVRLRNNFILITCLRCRALRKFPYGKRLQK